MLVTDFFGSVRNIELMTVNETDIEMSAVAPGDEKVTPFALFSAKQYNFSVSQAPPPLAMVSLKVVLF